MAMLELLSVFTFFSFSFFLHVAVWKTSIPKQPFVVLSLIFLGTLLLGLLALNLRYNVQIIQNIHISVMYLSYTAVYFLTYTGLQASGPSFLMLRLLESKGVLGAERQEFHSIITDEDFIKFRINEVIECGWVNCSEDKKMHLTSLGKSHLNTFTLYRKFTRMDDIGG